MTENLTTSTTVHFLICLLLDFDYVECFHELLLQKKYLNDQNRDFNSIVV